MRFDFDARQGGKTTRMLDWLSESTPENPRTLVVHSDNEKRILERRFAAAGGALGAVIVSAARYREDGGHNRMLREVAIDNVDLILRQMFGRVTVVSATREWDFFPVAVDTGDPYP